MPNKTMTDHNGFAIDDVPPSLARPFISLRNNASPTAVTADKDPNFLPRLEARAQVVAPADRLDHVARVANIMSTPREATPVIDHLTGRDIREPSTFNNPANHRFVETLAGSWTPNKARAKRTDAKGNPLPVFITKTNKHGKEVQIQVEAPFHYNEITGEKEYDDFRPVGRRIASDANGNPLTFATKPGELSLSGKRSSRTVMADIIDYDDDDPASLMERK